MRKFTLLFALLVCSIGFSQSSVSSLGGDNNPTYPQTRAAFQNTQTNTGSDILSNNLGPNNPTFVQAAEVEISPLLVPTNSDNSLAAVSSFGVDNANVVVTPSHMLAPCSEMNTSNAFENGLSYAAGSPFAAANDITVAADEDLELQQIVYNSFHVNGETIDAVDINYREDAGGLPGAIIGTELGVVPTSQTFLGTNFGFDISEIVLDITPQMLPGQAGTTTTYWIEFINGVTSGGGAVFWEISANAVNGNASATSNAGVYTIFDPLLDGVYTFNADCTPIGGGGGGPCSETVTSNAFENGLSYAAGSPFAAANDFTVPADTDFELTQIVYNSFHVNGETIDAVDINYREDAGGLPGAIIGTELGVVPTSQTFLGTNFGFDISEMVLDITPQMLPGQAGTTTTYWIEFINGVTSGGGAVFWEISANMVNGNASATSNAGVYTIFDPLLDGVAVMDGICTPIGGGGGAPCNETVTSNAFENGLSYAAGSPFAAANDFTVPADTDFELTQIVYNSFHVNGETIDAVDINYREDAGGLPGAVIGTELGVVPTSQTFLGTNFGFDISEMVLDITPQMLPGQAGTTTTYWIEFINGVTSGGGAVFWEISSNMVNGNASATSNAGVYTIFDPLLDGVAVLDGICTPMGGGPTCDVVQFDATGLPFDIDGAGDVTADCVGAPNLIPVTVGDPGTIGVDSNIDNVTITITHTFDGDLDIFLVAPDGTELILSDQNGGSGQNYIDTVFMDGGGDITAGTPPFTGTFEPEGGTFAAAFDGVDIQGDWALKVCDNFGGDTGTVDSFSLSICRPEPPTNDECVDAFPIACGDIVVGETITDTDSGGNPANDEWYSFTGSGSPQLVTLSLCDGGTDYDSLLRVFDACGGNEIATNDDACGLQSELSFLSDGTTTYFVMVEGFGSNNGNFSMEVTCVDPPPNDECAGALDITCGETVVGETDTASFDATAPVCVTGITAPGVWYTFTDDTGLVTDYTLSMCDGGTDYDSKITVYSGDCGALACVVDNDDTCGLQSEVTWQGDGSTTYYILVHGFAANTGNFSMALTCAPVPPPNDMIANSIDVDEIGFPYTDPAVAMPAATTEAGNPAGCNIDGANGVWYNFVPDGDGFATATIVSPAGASFVNFFSADSESATEDELTLVEFNGNQCAPQTDAIIPTDAGQAYYVFVVNTGGITDIVIDGNNLGTNDNAIEGFTYYPNPATDVLNLNSIDTIDNVAIYNLLGQQVLNDDVAATSGTLDVSNLAVGAYIMKVSVNGEIGTYKIIKR